MKEEYGRGRMMKKRKMMMKMRSMMAKGGDGVDGRWKGWEGRGGVWVGIERRKVSLFSLEKVIM